MTLRLGLAAEGDAGFFRTRAGVGDWAAVDGPVDDLAADDFDLEGWDLEGWDLEGWAVSDWEAGGFETRFFAALEEAALGCRLACLGCWDRDFATADLRCDGRGEVAIEKVLGAAGPQITRG